MINGLIFLVLVVKDDWDFGSCRFISWLYKFLLLVFRFLYLEFKNNSYKDGKWI